MFVADLTYFIKGLSLSIGFFSYGCGWNTCLGWSYENFFAIEGGLSLLLLKLIVDLFINGWYFGETDPAPKEDDNAFGFDYFISLGVCP